MYIAESLAHVHAKDLRTYMYHRGSPAVQNLNAFELHQSAVYPNKTDFAEWARAQDN